MTISPSLPSDPIGVPGPPQAADDRSSKYSIIGTAVVGAVIALAPHASASGQDDNFLALLAQAGIPARDGIPGVISYGHKVCEALDGGESASAIADTLANNAYAESPSHPLDQYRRSMVRFVQVSTQVFCPGHAGVAASHAGHHIVLVGLAVPHPPPAEPQAPQVQLVVPPPVAAPKPEQSPRPPEQKPPPPQEVTVPPPGAAPQPEQSPGARGQGPGATGGGPGLPGDAPPEPAPEPAEGHIDLLP